MQRLVLFVGTFGILFISTCLLDSTEFKKPNVEFYSNLIRSVPDGDTIGNLFFIDIQENIHKFWSKDYEKLEVLHKKKLIQS
jgi:hypothetical protein